MCQAGIRLRQGLLQHSCDPLSALLIITDGRCYAIFSKEGLRALYDSRGQCRGTPPPHQLRSAGSAAARFALPPHGTDTFPAAGRLLALQDCWAHVPSQRPSMDEVVTRLEAIQVSGEMAALDKAEPMCCCTIC